MSEFIWVGRRFWAAGVVLLRPGGSGDNIISARGVWSPRGRDHGYGFVGEAVRRLAGRWRKKSEIQLGRDASAVSAPVWRLSSRKEYAEPENLLFFTAPPITVSRDTGLPGAVHAVYYPIPRNPRVIRALWYMDREERSK